MVRIVDHTQRRNMILSASISNYINSANPVSSEALAQDFNLSSATVRNIFAELEEAGYLMHPYTSAGRVPTDKGYRYYVDFLMSQIELLDNEKKSVIGEYKNKIERLDDVLDAVASGKQISRNSRRSPARHDWRKIKTAGEAANRSIAREFRLAEHPKLHNGGRPPAFSNAAI